jgi:uncharacterized Zn-finger protein
MQKYHDQQLCLCTAAASRMLTCLSAIQGNFSLRWDPKNCNLELSITLFTQLWSKPECCTGKCLPRQEQVFWICRLSELILPKPVSVSTTVCTEADHGVLTQLKKQQRHSVGAGEHPYRCEVCNKTFSKTCKLKEHQRVHIGERPYCCDVCNKTFVDKSSLKVHQRLHTGERPYGCDVCTKTFSHKHVLKRHLSNCNQ